MFLEIVHLQPDCYCELGMSVCPKVAQIGPELGVSGIIKMTTEMLSL